MKCLSVADQIVNEFQTGFMPGKFIGENGILAQMVLEDAQAHGSDGHSLGLLLDQEKAYDRVNLDYLRQVLLHYGFPETFVNCIYSLFSQNKIKINVNGFLSEHDISKKREPLLRTVLDDPAILCR
ncbi:hypothetical protein G6F56_003756 [Rhizopus delemar]|nr:hypothetical protein G6F56_003756 [Rhizopus delemar]